MGGRANSGNGTMDYLRAPKVQAITSSILDKGIVTANRVIGPTPNHGLVDQHVPEDAFMIAFQLRDYHGDLWVDGKNVPLPVLQKGNFSAYDYNRSWQANMRSAFDCVNFHIPRQALTALDEDFDGKRVDGLNIAPGADVDDPVMRGLIGALLPAFETPALASKLFLDHMGLALCTHMAVTYGEAREVQPVRSGGLAVWQSRRATEIIDAGLDGDLQVADLARACNLSPSYFARAFKMSMGMTPHQWLNRRRIDKAMDLLRATHRPVAEVAMDCGFADQSHFTRVFSQIVGIPPGRWRRTLS